MISVITAVHNQLGMNRLFQEALRAHTLGEYELIIIDNKSRDGTREFFKNTSDTIVIENPGNYPYPVCQNQGIEKARSDVLVFLNNDVIVSPHWNTRALEIMNAQGLEIASCSGTNRLENRWRTRWHKHKWKAIRDVLLRVRGTSLDNLLLMHRLMFGNWTRYCKKYERHGFRTVEGYGGFCFIATRKGIEKVGKWDEEIAAADLDLFLRTKQRSQSSKDIKPVHIILSVYMHHYGRLTCNSRPEPMAAGFRLKSIREKWGSAASVLCNDMNRIYDDCFPRTLFRS